LLARAWATWLDMHEQKQNGASRVEKTLLQWRASHLARAWLTWRDMHELKQHAVSMLRSVVGRMTRKFSSDRYLLFFLPFELPSLCPVVSFRSIRSKRLIGWA
jgi:hypothetical protein